MKVGDKVYRFEMYAGIDCPCLHTMYITKVNPKSYYVNWYNTHDKRSRICYNAAIKKVAYLSKEDAFESFIARKKKYLKYLLNSIEITEKALSYKNKFKEVLNKNVNDDFMIGFD